MGSFVRRVPWRQNPQWVAWTVLLTSFFLCTLCSVAVPLSARNYVLHAKEPRPAYVTALAGTVQLRAPGKDEPTAVTADRRPVVEGSQINTGKNDRALLAVSAPGNGNQVLLTSQLYQDTSLRLEQARTPRFRWSQDAVQVTLYVDQGRLALASTPVNGRTTALQVVTPGANVTLSAGSFLIEVRDGETLVTPRAGTAQVQAANQTVTANAEERVSVKTGGAPDLPVPAALNLLHNGTFENNSLAGWEIVRDVAPEATPGEVTVETAGPRDVLRFVRKAEDDAPNMVGVRQALNRDVQGYESLVVRLDLQLLQQSVPGGGYLSSEYPVMVHVSYTDIYGKELNWYHGFYYLDLPAGTNWRQPTGERIPVGAWYAFESSNLMEELRDTRPARINFVQISASGHDYESRVSNVALTVR